MSSIGLEVVILSVTLSHPKEGDQVDEVKLELPACITQLLVTGKKPEAAGTAAAGPCSLRAYARDLNSVQAARFAPLMANSLTCEPGKAMACPTEVVLTDHVMVRGRYSSLDLTLMGYLEHDGADMVAHRASHPALDEGGAPLPQLAQGIQLTDLSLCSLAAASAAPAQPDPSMNLTRSHGGTTNTPLSTSAPTPSWADLSGGGTTPPADALMEGLTVAPGLPPAHATALDQALDYCKKMEEVRGQIQLEHPGNLLRPLMASAYDVCAVLQGSQPLQERSGRFLPALDAPDPSWTHEVVQMAITWCGLAPAFNKTSLPVEIAVGMAGLAAALLLCNAPSTCTAFIAEGGLHAITEVLQMAHPPSNMVRLAACVCEAIISTAGPLGCEVLLGWWAPQRAPTKEGAEAASAAAGVAAAKALQSHAAKLGLEDGKGVHSGADGALGPKSDPRVGVALKDEPVGEDGMQGVTEGGGHVKHEGVGRCDDVKEEGVDGGGGVGKGVVKQEHEGGRTGGNESGTHGVTRLSTRDGGTGADASMAEHARDDGGREVLSVQGDAGGDRHRGHSDAHEGGGAERGGRSCHGVDEKLGKEGGGKEDGLDEYGRQDGGEPSAGCDRGSPQCDAQQEGNDVVVQGRLNERVQGEGGGSGGGGYDEEEGNKQPQPGQGQQNVGDGDKGRGDQEMEEAQRQQGEGHKQQQQQQASQGQQPEHSQLGYSDAPVTDPDHPFYGLLHESYEGQPEVSKNGDAGAATSYRDEARSSSAGKKEEDSSKSKRGRSASRSVSRSPSHSGSRSRSRSRSRNRTPRGEGRRERRKRRRGSSSDSDRHRHSSRDRSPRRRSRSASRGRDRRGDSSRERGDRDRGSKGRGLRRRRSRGEERDSSSRRRTERASRMEGSAVASRDLIGSPTIIPPSRRGSSGLIGAEAGRVVAASRQYNCYALLLRAAASHALPAETGAMVVRVFRHLHAYDLLARLQRNAHQLMHAPPPVGTAPPPNTAGPEQTGAQPGSTAGTPGLQTATTHTAAQAAGNQTLTQAAGAPAGVGEDGTAAARAGAAATAHPADPPPAASAAHPAGPRASGGVANTTADFGPSPGAPGNATANGGVAATNSGPSVPAFDVVKVMREAAGQLAELADVLVVKQPVNKVSSDLGKLFPSGSPAIDEVVLRLLQPRGFFASLAVLVSGGTQAVAAAKRAVMSVRVQANTTGPAASSPVGAKPQQQGEEQGQQPQQLQQRQQQVEHQGLQQQQRQQLKQPQQQQQQQQQHLQVARARQAFQQLTQLNGQLVLALRAVVAALLSCRFGLAVVGSSASDVAMLIYALDPSTAAEGLGTAQLSSKTGAGGIRGPAPPAASKAAGAETKPGSLTLAATEVATLLHHALCAFRAARVLQGGAQGRHSEEVASAVYHLSAAARAPATSLVTTSALAPTPPTPAAAAAAAASSQPSTRALAVPSITPTIATAARLNALSALGWAPGALGALLALMRTRGRVHAAAVAPAVAAAAATAASLDELDMDGEFARDGGWGAISRLGGGGAAAMVGPLYASAVLLELVREAGQPQLLPLWAGAANAIVQAARAEQTGLGAGGGLEGGTMALCGAPHDDRSRRTLLELQGRAEVVAAVQSHGVHALLEALDAHLPHLVPCVSDHAARVGVGLRQPGGAPGATQSQNTGASWYLVANHDVDVRGVLGLVRAPDRLAATACALDLLRIALRPEVSDKGGATPSSKAAAAATAAALGDNKNGASVTAAAAAMEGLVSSSSEKGAGTVAAAKNIAGLQAGALLRVPWKQLVLQVYSADGLLFLERAAWAGAAALSAVAADFAWAWRAGDELDDRTRARNMATACELAASAAHAAAALVGALHEVMGTRAHLHSGGLLGALLALHAQLCLAPEGLAASLGGGGAGPTQLQLQQQAVAQGRGEKGGLAATTLSLARQAVGNALGLWAEAGWQPSLVQACLGVHTQPQGLQLDLSNTEVAAGSAGEEPARQSALSPAEVYTTTCLLGDVLPPEWPLQASPPQETAPAPAVAASAAGVSAGTGTGLVAAAKQMSTKPTSNAQAEPALSGGGGAAASGGPSASGGAPAPGYGGAGLLPPAQPARRAALLPQLIACEAALRRLLAFAAVCESRLVRLAAVRVVAKLAGLGPNMATFCVQPLVEPLTVAAKAVQAASAGASPPPPLAEVVRRVLEMVVPLSAKPAVKAGLLELRAAGVLSHLVHRLAPRLHSEGAMDALPAMSMCLEALVVLLNPDVALISSAPKEARLREDTPPLADCTQVAAALMGCLHHLPLASDHAHMVRSLLLASPAGLATHAQGRQALRQGMIRWQAMHTGAGPAGGAALAAAAVDPLQLQCALVWAVGRLQETEDRVRSALSQRASARAASGVGGLEEPGVGGVAAVARDLSEALQVAAEEGGAAPAAAASTPVSATMRISAALAMAEAQGVAAGARGPAVAAAAAAAAAAQQESVVTFFWRYARARGTRATSVVLPKKLDKWDVAAGASAGQPQSRGGGLPGGAVGLIAQGVTRRKRARSAPSPAAAAVAAATAAEMAARVASRRSTQQPAAPTVSISTTSSSAPASDIPSVMAPRKGNARRMGPGSGSRPASMHVDDFERPTPRARLGSVPMAAPPTGPSAPGLPVHLQPPTLPPALAMAGLKPGMPGPSGPIPLHLQPPPLPSQLQALPGPSPQTPPVPSPSVLDSSHGLYDDLFVSPGFSNPQMPRPPQPGGGSKPRSPAPQSMPQPQQQGSKTLKPLPPPPSASAVGNPHPLPPVPMPPQAPFNASNNSIAAELYNNVFDSQPTQQQQQQKQQQKQGGGPLPPPPALPGPSSTQASAPGAGGMTQQQIMALLQDPKKIVQLLQHNPGLASIVQKCLPPGFPLPKF